jgi:hypothetical protein
MADCPVESVASVLAPPLSPPVAPFSPSVRDRLNVSAGRDTRNDDWACSIAFTDDLSESRGDELTARREACCRDDAVFSRTSNWVGWGFTVVTRSS